MTAEKGRLDGSSAEGEEDRCERFDRRERFVLRGGADDRPSSVPADPEPAVDLEEVLRRLEWPERRRAHRHSEL